MRLGGTTISDVTNRDFAAQLGRHGFSPTSKGSGFVFTHPVKKLRVHLGTTANRGIGEDGLKTIAKQLNMTSKQLAHFLNTDEWPA